MKSVDITIKLIEVLARESQPLNVHEISHRLSFSKSTTHRALQGLAQEGFAKFDSATQRYHRGEKMIALALDLLSSLDIKFLAQPILKGIFEQINESVYLCVYINKKFYFVDKVESSHFVRYVNPLGERPWVHAGAPGKSVMAFLPQEEVDEIIARGLPALTNSTITNPEKLKVELARVRREGRAVSYSEYADGGWGVASPILDQQHYPYACIAVIIPEDRFHESRVQEYTELVKGGARKLMDQMNKAELKPYVV